MEVNPFFLHICLSGNEFYVRRQPDKTGFDEVKRIFIKSGDADCGMLYLSVNAVFVKMADKTAKCSMDVSAQIKRAKKPSENSIFGAGRFVFSIIYS